MTDTPYQLILANTQTQSDNCLWVMDESFPLSDVAKVAKQHTVITNRYDCYQAFKNTDHKVYFNDFELSNTITSPIDCICYRVSKEKTVTHHVINQAFQKLPINGELHLSGFKGDGIKTYIDKTKSLFGELVSLENGPNTAKYAVIRKTHESLDVLDDKQYVEPREIFTIGEQGVISKPGVFGWNKEDQGSLFLSDNLSSVLENSKGKLENVLDLGCGYGYLSLRAFHEQPLLRHARFTLTDNNAAAIHCATINTQAHKVHASVVADNAGQQLNERFDLILCNPPFHKGFDVSSDITEQFLKSTQRLLDKRGIALWVVNQFIGIEKRASTHFSNIEEVNRNKSFKLIALSKPKR